MSDPIVAAIAFFALGANLLGAALLLLFNPGNREVRGYVGFVALIMVWLLGLGVNAVTGDWGAWEYPYSAAVTLLPAAFVAVTLLDDPARPARHSWAALGLGVLAVPLGLSAMTDLLSVPADGTLFWIYQVAGWAGGSVILSRSHRRRRSGRAREGLDRIVTGFLVLVAPLVVALGFVLGAEAFFRHAMPLVTVVIQFAIFVGVTRMRFYDIQVRAARSGELAARIAETERLAVVGELAATVAHEVRNPLTGVRSLAQRIAEGGVDEERRRRYAAVILDEVGRIDRIVGNLLALARRAPELDREARPAPAEAPPTFLAPLFDDLRLLAAAAAEKAGVELEMLPGEAAAAAPRDPLAQALLNLLLNAIRLSPEGGRVLATAESDAGGTTIRVRDSGPGVPAAEREGIFEPFRTGGDGAGLGLSVVRRLSRDHGWEVGVGDAPDGGAEFVLRVPAPPSRQPGSAPRGPPVRSRAEAAVDGEGR